MGNMHIVTGFKGENHVTAADVGSLNAAIFGTGSYVLNRGSKLRTTTISNNKIRVADGDLMIQGRHVRLDEGTYVDLTIENGQQGYKRNDLIVARYTKNSSSGVEDVNLVVIKGTPAASNPVDPSYTTGDIINDHVYIADMPLFRIPLDGLNVQTIVPLYTLASILPDGSVTSEKISDGAVTEEKIEKGAVSYVVYATIPSSGEWHGDFPAYIDITVAGIANDSVIVDVDANGADWDANKEMIDQFCNLMSIQLGGDNMRFIFTEKPDSDIRIKILVIRK